jgi:hypothetical protein
MTGVARRSTLVGPSARGAADHRGKDVPRARESSVDQTYLLVLAVAIVVALVAGVRIRARMLRHSADVADAASTESPFAVSTEGEKICPRCGMGNLWTERRCISCGTALKG